MSTMLPRQTPGTSGAGLASRDVRTHNSSRQVRVPSGRGRGRGRGASNALAAVSRQMSSFEASQVQGATAQRMDRRTKSLPEPGTIPDAAVPTGEEPALDEPPPFEHPIYERVNRNDTSVCHSLSPNGRVVLNPCSRFGIIRRF